MSEKWSNPEEIHIRSIVETMYRECDANADLYENHGILRVQVEGVDWETIYWPQAKQEGRNALMLARKGSSQTHPTIYAAEYQGLVSRVEFMPELKKQLVEDPAVAETLCAILVAAHEAKLAAT